MESSFNQPMDSEATAKCKICFNTIYTDTNIDPGSKLIFCNKCGISVHRRCCGITDTHFTCPKCTLQPTPCLICGHSEEYMQEISSGNWIHPICALLTDNIEVKDFGAMKFELVKELAHLFLQCEYCGTSNGQLLQCECPSCLKAAHAFCAIQHEWRIELALGKNTKGLNKNDILKSRGGLIFIHCGLHGDLKEDYKERDEMNCKGCNKWYVGKDGVCGQCRMWNEAKSLYLLKKELNYEEIVKEEWVLYPCNTNKLIDILLISDVYSKCVQLLLKNQSTSKAICRFLDYAAEIPMMLHILTEKLQGKLKKVIKLDQEIEAKIRERPVLNIIDKNYNLIESNFEKNEELKTTIETCGNKEHLKDLLMLVNALHEIGLKFFSGMELKEALKCLRQLEKSKSEGQSFDIEIQFLQDMITQFKDWEARLYSLEKPVVTNEMIFPVEGIGQVNNKIKELEEVLSKKAPLNKIEDLLQEVAINFIRCESISTILKTEKSLFEERSKKYEDFLQSGCTLEKFKALIKEMYEGLVSSESDITILHEYGKFLRLHFVCMALLINGILINYDTGEVIKDKCMLDDVKKFIKECEKNAIRPLDLIEASKNRINEVNEWCEQNQDLDDNPEILNDYIIKGKSYKALLPEYEIIHARVDLLESVEVFLKSEKQIPFEELNELIEKATTYKLPNNLLDPLKILCTKAQKLTQEGEELLNAVKTSYKVLERIKKLIKEMEKFIITLPVQETLGKVVEEAAWQREVIATLKNSLASENQPISLEVMSKEDIEDALGELNRITSSPIGPARKTKKRMRQILWLDNVKEKLESVNKLDEDELLELVKEMNDAEITIKNSACGKYVKQLLNLHEIYTNITSEYEKLHEINLDALPEKEFPRVLERLYTLKRRAFMCQVNLSDLIIKIHNTELYVDSYQLLIKLTKAKESAGIDHSFYSKAIGSCVSYQEDQTGSETLMKINEQFEEYKKWMERYKEYKEMKEEGISYDINSLKKMLKDAAELEFPIKEDLESLKNDIEQGESTENFARELLYKLPNEEVKVEEIEANIKKVQNLPLYSKEVLYGLKGHLWLLQVKNLILPDTPKHELDYWHLMLKERDRILGEGIEIEELTKGELVDKVQSLNEEGITLMKQVNKLRANKLRGITSSSDLQPLLNSLSSSHIDFKTEINYINKLIVKADILRERLKKLVTSKASFKEFEEFADELTSFPLNLKEPEEELNRTIEFGNSLIQKAEILIARSKKDRLKIREVDLIPILRGYLEFFCTIDEIEDLKDQYEQAKKAIIELNEELDKEISLKSIEHVSKLLDALPIEMNESAQSLLLRIAMEKYDLLIKDKDKPSVNAVKELMQDFRKVKNKSEKAMNVEKLIAESEDNIKKVQQIFKLQELENIEKKLWEESLDYTELIAEQKAQIESTLKITGKRTRANETVNRPRENLDRLEKQRANFRKSTRNSFEELMNENKKLKKGVNTNTFAKEIEEGLFQQAKESVGDFYKERAEIVRIRIAKTASYPFLSEYIGNGKLQFWKLLRMKEQLNFIRRVEEMEGILAQKAAKKRKLEEDAAATRCKLRLNILREEVKGSNEESPVKYDPLQVPIANKDELHFNEPLNPTDNREQNVIEDNRPYNPLATRTEPSKRPITKSILMPSNNEEQIVETALVGSLLKIWAGKIQTDKGSFKCSMYTCEDIKKYQQAPALINSLSMDGRARINDVYQYIDENESKLLILKGWIIIDEAMEVANNYLEGLESTEKCGVIKIKEIASHLYLIPWNEKTDTFMRKWKVSPEFENESQSTMLKFGYFFALKEHMLIHSYKMMQPTFIRPPHRVPITVPSVENEIQEVPEINPADEIIKQTLKEKLAALSREEIENLKSQVEWPNKELLERVLEELYFSNQPEPMQDIDETAYMWKIHNLQKFMTQNRAYFIQYAVELQTQQLMAAR